MNIFFFIICYFFLIDAITVVAFAVVAIGVIFLFFLFLFFFKLSSSPSQYLLPSSSPSPSYNDIFGNLGDKYEVFMNSYIYEGKESIKLQSIELHSLELHV